MNLGELLEELRENILHDRSDRVAGESDRLWSDRTLIRYINEAERRLAREALVIRDNSTEEVCIVKTREFVREYPLHPSICAVISARCFGDRADLARGGHSAFDTYHTPDTYFFDPSSLSALPPGKIVAWDTDEGVLPDNEGSMGRAQLRLYPSPDPVHAQPISLRVVRYPLRPLRRKHDVPEVPAEHHLDMLDWAAYLALRIVDVDGGSPDRALEFRQSFETHVAEARKVAMRKLFAVSNWGFGRNGFSWEIN
jgi:hypothetical protein